MGWTEVVFILFLLFAVSLAFLLKIRELGRNSAQLLETVQQYKEKKSAWRRKLQEARHLLTGESWMDPAGKMDFVRAVLDRNEQNWYHGVPRYQWFALGDVQITQDDMRAWIALFFTAHDPDFGDIEVHESRVPGMGFLLRIRRGDVFLDCVGLAGKTCPLYQVGASNVFGDIEEGVINFLDVYKTAEPAAV